MRCMLGVGGSGSMQRWTRHTQPPEQSAYTNNRSTSKNRSFVSACPGPTSPPAPPSATTRTSDTRRTTAAGFLVIFRPTQPSPIASLLSIAAVKLLGVMKAVILSLPAVTFTATAAATGLAVLPTRLTPTATYHLIHSSATQPMVIFILTLSLHVLQTVL